LDWLGVKGKIMVFTKARSKLLLLAGSLAVAVTAFTVTACGGGSPAALAQGAAPGQWTKAEVGQFTAAGGGSSGDSQDSCIIGNFERDMSFGNAMAVVSVDPASGASMSTAQVKAALVSKYGTTEGDAINAQFEQTVTDSGNNCAGSAASSTAPATAPVSTAAPAAAPIASTSAPAATTPALAATTPAAAASLVGTWNVAYTSAPASILGQYSFTEDGGFYYMSTKTVLKVPAGNCSLPAGTEIGSFSASGGTGNYSGTENLYEQGTCAFAGTTAAFTATVSGDTIMLMVPDQQSVTLTSAGSAASSPVASAPAPSTDCIVPDVIGAGLNGNIAAAAAESKVSSTCPPVGYHVVTVLTVSGPAGTSQGELWKESPAAGSSEPAGSTVTLYFQP
jgi:S-DNA-T family DNA segregation ATPase FtsK/SpoIIIE